MGSVFYTYEEAANRLGKSRRTIFNYIDQGFLKPQRQGSNKVLLKEEVEQLAVELGTDMPALSRKTFFQLMAKVRKLEEEMTVVRRILDIRSNPLHPTDPNEARGLLAAAREAMVRKGGWMTQELTLWAGVFDRMDEVTLEFVQQATQDPQSWAAFYNLCLAMVEQVSRDHAQTPDLKLQALFQRLDEGRKKLRGTVLMWLEMGKGKIPENFLRDTEGAKEALLRRLAQGSKSR